jgi:hypothetical protein
VYILWGYFSVLVMTLFLKTLKLAYNMKNITIDTVDGAIVLTNKHALSVCKYVMMMMMTAVLVLMMTITGMLTAIMLVVMIDTVDGGNTLYIILTSVILSLGKLENIYKQKTNYGSDKWRWKYVSR